LAAAQRAEPTADAGGSTLEEAARIYDGAFCAPSRREL
jgi:hypothetical protein